MRTLFRSSCLVVGSFLLFGCGGSKAGWVPDEALLAEAVMVNPETDALRVGRVVREYFDAAIFDAGSGNNLTGSKRTNRFRDAFEVLRSRYAAGGPLTHGFNACFPQSYSLPKDASINQLMIYGWECQLIQGNGPSVALLRKDPFVAKYLDARGNLVARGDIDQMHAELNGAMYLIDPTNSQRPAYPAAQGNLEKVLAQWERPRS